MKGGRSSQVFSDSARAFPPYVSARSNCEPRVYRREEGEESARARDRV